MLLHHPPPPASQPLSLHDALPISSSASGSCALVGSSRMRIGQSRTKMRASASFCHCPPLSSSPSRKRLPSRSEEHTSELQSRLQLVCRRPPAKKKQERAVSMIGSL